ncbi:FAD-dependent oxidoreductase [Geodermatophilus sp. SYSU D00703]
MTLALCLRGAGLHPFLPERRPSGADRGHVLGLVPLVDPALRHLQVGGTYRERSVPVRRYTLRDRAGRPLREYSFESLLASGDHRGIERGELLAVPAAAGGRVSNGATVTRIEQDGGRVRAYDTGWGGWVGWTDPDDAPDRYEECWGRGFFLGTYPVRGRVGVFLGGPRRDTARGAAEFVGRVRGRLRADDARLERALRTVAAGHGTHYWPMTDVRARTWTSRRVVLLGDAAAGFLPTAGIGAAMAIESADVLGRSLARATPGSVPAVPRDHEARQRPRVESAQRTSRVLGRLVFRTSRPAAVVRDLASRFVPLDRALAPIVRLVADRPRGG